MSRECAYHFLKAVDCFCVAIHITHIYIYIYIIKLATNSRRPPCHASREKKKERENKMASVINIGLFIGHNDRSILRL